MKGRVVVGFDSSQTEFNFLNKTGGEKTHPLVEAEMPSHFHTTSFTTTGYTASYNSSTEALSDDRNNGWTTRTTDTKGSGTAHNNLQPYLILNYIIK